MRQTASATAALGLSSLLLWGCGSAGLGRPADPASPLEVLEQREPLVDWEAGTRIEADFDADGDQEWAFLGRKGPFVLVGIVHAPLGDEARHWVLEFDTREETQESLCSEAATLSREELSEEMAFDEIPALPAGTMGLTLADERCDAFHIYWSPAEGKYVWWRL
jgi:hypothetical protein